MSIVLVAQDDSSQSNNQERDKPNSGLQLTLSKETTFFVRPVRKNGLIDYASAINEEMKKGVTSKTNAFVELSRAVGPKPDGFPIPDKVYAQLGMERPQERADNLQSIFDWMESKKFSADEKDKLLNELDRIISSPWSRTDCPVIADWIQQNKKALELVRAATQKPKYFAPLVVDYGEGEDPEPLVSSITASTHQLRNAGQLLCIRAMRKLHDKEYAAAWSDLMTCKRLGRIVGKGPTITESLIGFGIENMSHEASLVFIRQSEPNAKLCRQYRQQLNQIPKITSLRDKVLLAERCMMLDSLNVMATGNEDQKLQLDLVDGLGRLSRTVDQFELEIDLDSAYRECNLTFVRFARVLEERNCQQRKKSVAKLLRELKELAADIDLRERVKNALPKEQKIILSKLIGSMAAAIHIGELAPLCWSADRAEQNASNLDTSLALLEFRASKGSYPIDLSELVPKYLESKPRDRFSGSGLKYRRLELGYQLYSVGVNGKDDLGRSYDDDPQGDDLKIKMPN